MAQPPKDLAWDDFRLVKAVAEARGLTGAAERLGVNHSTMFRRLGQVEAGVDLLEEEVAVLVGDLGVRVVDPGVRGADDRPSAHGDDVEQALRVAEEREHAVVPRRRESRDDEVDALGVHDAVVRRQAP